MVDTIVDRLQATMDDWNVQLILATDPFLVAEPLREVLVLWTAATMAEGILEITTTGPCGHPQGTREDLLSVGRPSGSLGNLETREMSETSEIIANDLIIEDILCHRGWSPEGRLRTPIYLKGMAHTNATCRHPGRTGQTLPPRDYRPLTCQQPPMALQSIQLVQP